MRTIAPLHLFESGRSPLCVESGRSLFCFSLVIGMWLVVIARSSGSR
ncbi:hypothetical protein [Phormidesmis priestleyi]